MAADKVNMSLDDIIKMSRTGRGRGRGRTNLGRGAARNAVLASNPGRSVGTGQRRGNFGSLRRGTQRFGGVQRGGIVKRSQNTNRNFLSRNVDGIWTHDLFEGAVVNVRDEGKLLISNLDYGVSDNDMKELFSEFGPLKKAAVHYDFSGRSLGTAEVIFASKKDAIRAMNQYNTVPLDGRPMKIQIAESLPNVERQVQRDPANRGSRGFANRGGRGLANRGSRGLGNRGNRGIRQNFGRGAYAGRKLRGGRGLGRGRGAARATNLTKEQLDAQLDDYNKMEVN